MVKFKTSLVSWFFLCALSLINFIYAQGGMLDVDVAKKILTPKQLDFYKYNLDLLKQSKEKKLTIFYLTSNNLITGSKNFLASIQKLNDRDAIVEGKVILRGFPEDIFSFVQSNYQENVYGEIKVHPMIFRAFNIKKVPAFVLSYCPFGENFSFNECENKFVANGDITLVDFFSMISDYDKQYQKYYFTLIKPD